MNSKCEMWNAKLKWEVGRLTTLTDTFRIPHSNFRIQLP